MIETIATFNSVSLPNGTYSVGYQNIENVAQSEAGTDLTIVTRLKKRAITATYKVDSHVLPILEDASDRSQASMTFCGSTFIARCRMTSCNLVEDSENVENTEGLWEVTLVFTEV